MRTLRITTLQYAVGVFCAVIGAMMFVAPHQFYTVPYRAFEPYLPAWGVLFLVAGGGLLTAAALTLRRPFVVGAHLVGGAALLTLAAGFAPVGSWTGVCVYATLAAGTMAAVVVLPRRPPLQAPQGADLFTLVMAVAAMLNGALLVAVARGLLTEPFFAVTPDTTKLACGVAFLTSGLLLALVETRAAAPRAAVWAAHLALAVAFLTYVVLGNVVVNRFWTGLAYYAGFGVLLALLPWLGPRLRVRDRASLRTQLALMGAAAAALPLIIAVTLTSDQGERSATAQALSRHQGLATALAENVEQYVHRHRATVAAVAAQPGLADLTPADHRRLLQRVAAVYTDAAAFATYDADGHPVARSDDGPLASMADSVLFARVRSAQAPSFDMRLGQLTGRPVLMFGAPVMGARDRFAGMALVVIECPQLGEVLRDASAGAGVEAYLVDRDGRVIVHAGPGAVAFLSDLSAAPPVAAALRAPRVPGALRYGPRAAERLAGHAPVEEVDWSVVVEQSTAVTLAGVRRERDATFAVLVLVAGGAALVGGLVAGRLTAPLRTLRRAVDRFTAGDVSAPLPLTDVSDVAHLATAFGEMRERLITRDREGQRLLAQLETERARFEAVVRQMPAGVAIAEADGGRITLLNAQAERIWGAAEYNGPPRGYHGDGRPCAPEEWPAMRSLTTGEVVVDEEIDVVRADGGLCSMQISSAPIRERDGRITAAVLTFRDITEQREAERERALLLVRAQAARVEAEAAQRRSAFLAEASRVLAASLDTDVALKSLARVAVPELGDWCAVDMLGDDGSIRRLAAVHVDPARERLASELIGLYPLRLGARDGVPVMLRAGRSKLYREVPDWWFTAAARTPAELAVLRGLGLQSAMVVPLRARGRTLGALTFLTAESNRRYGRIELELAEDLAHRAALAIDNARLYREAQAADHRKDQFVAMLAHELRNPLAPIANSVHVLERSAGLTGAAASLLAIVRRQTSHLARLVDDLLDVSRITSGKITLQRRPVDLNEVARRSVDSLRASGKLQHHDVALALAPEPLVIDADPVRIEQVIVNLLDNAVKYSLPDAPIRVSTERVAGTAELRVRDHGIGLEPEMLKQVFGLFTQAEASLDRSRGGLGLGLALVRSLVEQHGGSVRAQSEGRDQGSEFIVDLPLVGAGPAPEDPLATPAAAAAARVLIVEDNVDARETLRLVLTSAGHHVDVAGDGQGGLEAAVARRPDIALIDIGLPGMDGYEVARRLRATEAGKEMHLIALTGYGQPEDRRRARDAGFDAHLVKPINPDDLLRALAGARRAS